MLSRFILVSWLLILLPTCTELDQSLKVFWLPAIVGTLNETMIAEGLKEALQVGTGNAVNFTGKLDRYLHNQASDQDPNAGATPAT